MDNTKVKKKLIIRFSKYDGYCEILFLSRKKFFSINYWDMEVLHHVPDNIVSSVVGQYQERIQGLFVSDLRNMQNNTLIQNKSRLHDLLFKS